MAYGTIKVDTITSSTKTVSVDTILTSTGTNTFAGLTLEDQGLLKFEDADGSNWLALRAPTTVASNVTWTLPSTDGTSGQILSTNGSGTLSWTSDNSGVITACCSSNFLSCNTSATGITTGADNIFIGCAAGACTTFGSDNFFAGRCAGNANTSGNYNTFLGSCAGHDNETGANNVYIGNRAGCISTSASNNVFIGQNSGQVITGGCNVVIGSFDGTGYAACCDHIFLSDGSGDLRVNINGSGAVGFGSASYGSAGSFLRSGGSAAGPSWTTATFPNTATSSGTILRADGTNWVATTATYPTTTTANQILYSSATNTISGLTGANTAVLVTNSSGVPSFVAGSTANRLLKTNGTSISFAQVDLTTDVTGTLPIANGGTNSTATPTGGGIAYGTGSAFAFTSAGSSGQVLTSSGAGAPTWSTIASSPIAGCCTSNFLSCNTCAPNISSGANNFLLGSNAGLCLTSGSNNFFAGPSAGCRSSTNSDNVFIGCFAGASSSGTGSVFLGAGAGLSATGSDNVAIGYKTSGTNGGIRNIALGNYALNSNQGWWNIALGERALGGAGGSIDGNSRCNIAIGYYAGKLSRLGSRNIFLGANAGCNATGSENIFIGSFTGTGFTACNNHIFLSDGAGNNRLQINNSGALGVAGACYGTAGQVLTSGGSGSAPTWTTVSSGSSAFAGCCTSNFLSCNTCAPGITSAASNFFVGCNAGICTTTGSYNNVMGSFAGTYNFASSHNNFFGNESGYGQGSLATGSDNNFFGRAAGCCISTASHNNFLGRNAGRVNSSGCHNFFGGYNTGRCLTTGCHNVAIGCCALGLNITGNDNIAIGQFAGRLVAGSCNIFIGRGAGSCTTSNIASSNIAVGSFAGRCITSGQSNIVLGLYAYRGSTGGCNLVAGQCAGYNATLGNNNIFLGQNAGFCYIGTAGQNQNIFIGCNAGCLITGGCNVVIGSFTGTSYANCCNHIFLSDGAGNNRAQFNGSGALGIAGACYGTAGQVLTSCGSGQAPVWAAAGGGSSAFAGCCTSNFLSCNTCAPNITSAVNNFFVGFNAGLCTTSGSFNNFLGMCAGLFNTTGSFSNIFGHYAGRYNTTGSENNFLGCWAGYNNTTGSYNTYIGKQAGQVNTTGTNNFLVGFQAGLYNTASNNIYLGYRAGFYNSTGSNNIAIGCNSGNDALRNFQTSGASNTIVIGNSSHTAAFVKVAWTTGSDSRDKTNIVPIPVGKEFLQQLNPVQFNWADRETGEVTAEKPNYGFLAQDILELENPPLVLVDDNDPEHLKLRESMIVPILVKTVQELIDEVDVLKEEIRKLKNS